MAKTALPLVSALRRRQRPAGHLPPRPRHRPAAGRVAHGPLQRGDGAAAVRPAAVHHGRRHGPAGRRPAAGASERRLGHGRPRPGASRFRGLRRPRRRPTDLGRRHHGGGAAPAWAAAPRSRSSARPRRPTARALLDRLLAQDDEPKVPVVEHDRRAARSRAGPTAGATTTCPRTARPGGRSLATLDADAHARPGAPFARLGRRRPARDVLRGGPRPGRRRLARPAGRPGVRSLWMRYACTAFYSHPWAWNEIGFGGPAYPRGYKNLGLDRREPWEGRSATPTTRSRGPTVSNGRDAAGERRRTSERRTLVRSACPQRVGLAAAERRHAHQPRLAPRHAPLRRRRRGRPRHRRLRRRRRRARPAAGPRRLDGGRLRRRPVLGSRPRLGQRRSAARHHLYWTEPRVIAGDDPVPLGVEQLRARRRRFDGALRRLRAPLPSLRLPHRVARRRRRRLADHATRTCSPTTSTSSRSSRSPGEPWPWGDPHRYPQSPHPVGGNGLVFSEAASGSGIEVRVGPVAITNGRFGQPSALHLPRVLPPGLQGQRQGVAAHHPRPRRPGPRRRDPRRLHGEPRSSSTPTAGPPASPTSATASSAASAPAWSPSPATPSRRRGCC